MTKMRRTREHDDRVAVAVETDCVFQFGERMKYSTVVVVAVVVVAVVVAEVVPVGGVADVAVRSDTQDDDGDEKRDQLSSPRWWS